MQDAHSIFKRPTWLAAPQLPSDRSSVVRFAVRARSPPHPLTGRISQRDWACRLDGDQRELRLRDQRWPRCIFNPASFPQATS